VVTDPFTVPPIWFFEKNIKYFVFSELAKKTALAQGVQEKNIFVVAPVINEKFLQARGLGKGEVRGKLGLPQDKKVVLVAAGGDGLYKGGKIVRSLMNLSDDFRLIVVCGREKKFFDQVNCLKEKYPDKILLVTGFAENMEEFMAAADLVVSKAGPAVVFESLTMGRPLVLTYYIWGQEKGNRDFVVDNGFGRYEPQTDRLAQTVADFFANESEYKNTLERISALSLKTGVGEIAQKILKQKNLD
jgi:processive 1,2-diacylglycerol beta-glucosyltransferase/1,2-diacylglycerol 3-beta-galactosyltransferase